MAYEYTDWAEVWLMAHILETVLKMFAMRTLYWKDGFNILDMAFVNSNPLAQLRQSILGLQFLRIVCKPRIWKILHVRNIPDGPWGSRQLSKP